MDQIERPPGIGGPFDWQRQCGRCYFPAPWHFLYFFPDPQGQGSFRPTSGTDPPPAPSLPSELETAGAATGGRGSTGRGAAPMNRSSAADAGGGGGGGMRRCCGGGSAVTWILRNRSVNVP